MVFPTFFHFFFFFGCCFCGNRDLSLPLGLALGSPIFPSGCEGKLGVALESLQGHSPSSDSSQKLENHADVFLFLTKSSGVGVQAKLYQGLFSFVRSWFSATIWPV